MSSPIDCWRSLIADVRRRLREMRECRSCYKVGLATPDPPGPDDVITANDQWEDHSTTIVVRHRSDDPLDLREIN